ncbi:molybdopterin-synthase adenylyltransferase MoeB [Hymenobacter oligotrophus]|uniref:Molybdopterin-synthase adenylyltransferase n=1 Tax=Hymenobacter oligotrophus TaxID=2319843 RepID=A0A3B7R488_9BACT|nr:molybdopterin-synthase adenylyltransferase MoeB [Hymenobacter oligotrophus]AYA36139.1 molybdopterin-synthase adenylyltransferase MoeB [Hymenobacter oligotrophus]
MLTPDERHRYRRHLQLPEIGEAGQLRLRSARVLVVGAGGLGCPVLQYLAAAGVGTLGIADADQVELSNLQRQILYGPADLGQPKATTAAREVQRLNPLVLREVHTLRVGPGNVRELVAAYDVVVDGSDNFATRYLLNDACVSLGKPLISGAIYKFEGQVSVFNYQGGPTYRCLFPEPPGPHEAPNCDTTGVLGVLPGVVGTTQALETLKVILHLGNVLSGRLWVLDALTFQTRTLRFARHPERSLINLDTADATAYQQVCAPTMGSIKPRELQQLLQTGQAPYMLDVREPDEYELCHLPQATLLPLSHLADGVAMLPRQGNIVVYCHRGGRSARAIQQLEQQGFSNLLNLEGGIDAWATEVDKQMPRY